MGAAASRLPDRVDADVARAAFGDRFSRDVFDRLADGDGTCARHLLRLRCRLAALGAAASLEVCPADAARAVPSARPRAATVVDDCAALAPRPVFVNHVSKDRTHFAAVAAACGLLRAAGFDAVPHAPASRFEKSDDAAAVVAAYGSPAASAGAANKARRSPTSRGARLGRGFG